MTSCTRSSRMALGISIRRQTGGLEPCRLTLTRCTVVAACFGKRGSFWMATRLPPTNVCWPSRSSSCCIRTSPAFASTCHSIRASSPADGVGFFGMPPLFQALRRFCGSSSSVSHPAGLASSPWLRSAARPCTGGREATGMSEYQYYEFLALDRPLTAEQRAELRSISSRAEITATRFVNEYQWGDLRGDPLQMVKEYFDAFLYLANWGTRQVMFRLPRGVLDPEIARPYCYTDTASLIETDGHLILSLNVDQEEADDYWDEPGGQLAVMVQARSELAAGDLRLLYLSWLLALQSDFVDDEDTAPSVPPGLKNL